MSHSTTITGISELVTNDGADWELGIRHDAAVVVEDGRIAWIGPRQAAPSTDDQRDLGGRTLIPGFVDSHSHIVFAGDRSEEFAHRMQGEPYTGGGIGQTVRATRAASDDDLRASTRRLLRESRKQGTTTVEIKSGYGLTTAEERRLLRIAGEHTDEVTFLGGHVVPAEYEHDPDGYVSLIVNEMTPACAPLARWADVFCEPHSAHAFTGEQSRAILQAGLQNGLQLRVHGAQLGPGPGPQLAVELGAASLDHATFLTDADISALASVRAQGGPVVTYLPIVEFSTKQPFPDARRTIDAGIPVAIATDCNPGTCFSNSMPLAIAFAVRDMRMSPDEALWSSTAGGAKALRRSDIGRIRVGARADLAVIDAPNHLHIAYRAGVPLVSALELYPKANRS